MNNLSNNIYRYYLSRFEDLPQDKQFHFASRLYLWNRDEAMQQRLAGLRPWFTADEHPKAALRAVIEQTRQLPVFGSKNAAELRRPYFEKYPNLKVYVAALFRIMFLSSVYQLEAANMFYDNFARNEVEAYVSSLLADPAAIAVLSTHAVNFLYLYSRAVTHTPSLAEPQYFLDIGARHYNHRDPIHLQLLIYLYTHCIIGESQFYLRAVGHDPLYHRMLTELEHLIDEHFGAVNLDNKFEFLVCARLLGYETGLQERIYDEAQRSLAPDGSFLIDRHNSNPQTANVDLATSEHRNVLFILATRPYHPLD